MLQPLVHFGFARAVNAGTVAASEWPGRFPVPGSRRSDAVAISERDCSCAGD